MAIGFGMAIAARSFGNRTLCSPPVWLGLVAPFRGITHSRHLSAELNDSETLGSSSRPDLASSEADSEGSQSVALEESEVRQNIRPYVEELRDSLRAKYFFQEPVAKPNSFSRKHAEKTTLQHLRVKYDNSVSGLRKKYARELEKTKTAKATHDLKQRKEILMAKEERLRLKKEKSAQRAVEVETERQILQAKLASERAERAMHLKEKQKKLEERRQKGRDIIRHQSGTWVEEKYLETKIIEALVSAVEL